MFEQLLIAAIFAGLFYGLVMTRVAPARLFAGAMGAVYFAGLVSTDELLDKATNTGLVTLMLLLLVSVGLGVFGSLRLRVFGGGGWIY